MLYMVKLGLDVHDILERLGLRAKKSRGPRLHCEHRTTFIHHIHQQRGISLRTGHLSLILAMFTSIN